LTSATQVKQELDALANRVGQDMAQLRVTVREAGPIGPAGATGPQGAQGASDPPALPPAARRRVLLIN